jgi:hypothetical protein
MSTLPIDLYKQNLSEEVKQDRIETMTGARSQDLIHNLNVSYTEERNDNIKIINNTNKLIETSSKVIVENNKEVANKDRMIYILANLLLVILLIVVIFLCNRLAIISSRNAQILIGIALILYLFKVFHKYYWNTALSESTALKRFTEQTMNAVGTATRDNIFPSWSYKCPSGCKPKQSKMKTGPGGRRDFSDVNDLKTDSDENVWIKGDPNPAQYKCEDDDGNMIDTTIPCEEYVKAYKQVSVKY